MKSFTIFSLLLIGMLSSCSNDSSNLIPVAKEDKWGFIDKKGKEIIPFEFLWAEEFVDGMALVRDNNSKCGYIGTNGEYIIPPTFDNAESFSDGMAAVTGGYIDKTGEIVIKTDWNKPFNDGYTPVRGYKQRGYMNKKGEFSSFSNASQVKDFSDNMAAIKSTHWGYIDKDLKIKIKAQFFSAGPFSEGLAAVSTTGKEYGYIDNNGNMVIAPQFRDARPFNDGLALVWPHDAKIFWTVDTKGALQFECAYNDVRDYKEGMAAVYNFGEGWGFIDKTGKLVVAPQYEMVGDFYNGVAPVMVNHKFGFIDKTGKIIIEPIYDVVQMKRSNRF